MPKNTRKNTLESYEALSIASKKAKEMQESTSYNPAGKGVFKPDVASDFSGAKLEWKPVVSISSDKGHAARLRAADSNKARATRSSATRILVK